MIGKPNHDGSEFGVASGRIRNSSQLCRRSFRKAKLAFALGDESRRLVELGQPAGGLHVGDLEVVAEIAVGVLVVVAFRQIAELLAEATAAGVVLARWAVAVAAPVAEAFGNLLQLAVVGEDRTALAHGDVVRRVETQGADVTEGTDHLPVVGRAERIAAVLDQPEIVFLAQRGDHLRGCTGCRAYGPA